MSKVIGRVHSYESFSTLDGPGIRFVVFMQGCPLRCIYCQNPDTWRYEDGKETSVDEILSQLESARSFMEKDRGGITFSGGEPLAQPEFVREVFLKAKERMNITTAIDTSGCVPITEDIDVLLDSTDFVLIDVKHVDPAKHVVITGRSRGLIKEFIDFVQTKPNLKLWVRHVVVPGYTTDEDDIKKIAEYIGSLNQVERVDLLPYHDMGEFKWELVDRDYKLKDIEPPSKEMILDIIKKMTEYGGITPRSVYTEE